MFPDWYDFLFLRDECAQQVKHSPFASVCPGFFVQNFFPSKITSIIQSAPLESIMGWQDMAWTRKQKRLNISLTVQCPRNFPVLNRTASKHNKLHSEQKQLKDENEKH